MSVNSKDKGARYERELASKFREYGFDTHRSAQYCGNSGEAADVVGLPFIHVEAKRQEKSMLYDWMAQAKWDSRKSGRLPAVFFRKSQHNTLVFMELDDWMKLYQAFYECRMEDAIADEAEKETDAG